MGSGTVKVGIDGTTATTNVSAIPGPQLLLANTVIMPDDPTGPTVTVMVVSALAVMDQASGIVHV
jgi:hypothetical protein